MKILDYQLSKFWCPHSSTYMKYLDVSIRCRMILAYGRHIKVEYLEPTDNIASLRPNTCLGY
mgnify:CR=1 FL=1